MGERFMKKVGQLTDKYSSRKFVAFCIWAVLATFSIGVTVLTLRWAILNSVVNVSPLETLTNFTKFVVIIFAAMTSVYIGMNIVDKFLGGKLGILPEQKAPCDPPAK